MGLCNLENIDENIRLRKKIYDHYKEELGDIGIKFQKVIASRYNYIYMPICFKNREQRDEVYSELIRNGIKPRKYFFPLTVNFDYFKEKGVNLVEQYDLRKANDVANTILCLPLYPDLDILVVDNIIRIIKLTMK